MKAFRKFVLSWMILGAALASTQVPAQQPAKPAFQMRFFAPIDFNTINQLIGAIDQQYKNGTRDFSILLASPGGDPSAALAAYKYLHGMTDANITTFNLGNVDSAANIIFCAGKHRYAMPGTRFLVHGASYVAQPGLTLDSAGLDAQIQQVKNLNQMIVQVIASATKNRTQEIDQAVRSQKILSAEEAKTWGLVEDIRQEYYVPGATLASISTPSDTKPKEQPNSPFTSISDQNISDR